MLATVMRCNIDAKGKAVRLWVGLSLILASGVCALLTAASVLPSDWAWWLVAALAAVGLMGVFEARAGWCVVRAMGMKTRV